jgi:hypothetical protein
MRQGSMSAEIISAIAAVVSAVGGAFAAWAAMRSAKSAQDTKDAATDSERRALLRQVILTAKDVDLEAERALGVAISVGRSRDSLAIFSGALGGSRHKLDKGALEARVARVNEIQSEGKLFSAWPSTLEKAPLDEIDRVVTKLLSRRAEAVGAREDLQREHDSLERQCDTFRQKVTQG